jgi:prepilin-type N-terminal cleavage/methylation domain-containing protein
MNQRGFTLLEVLVALVILSLTVVTLLQLSAQGLRLLKLSGDYQDAALLADRLARGADTGVERVETGVEGPLAWERRVAEVATPVELAAPDEPTPRLLALTVTVRWGPARSLQLASLRTAPVPLGADR